MSSNAEIAARLYECFTTGDMEGLFALLDPEIEWELVGPEEIPYFGRYSGVDEVRSFFELLGANLEVEAFEVESVVATDSGAVAQVSERARFTANGGRYDMRWCHLIETSDGRIVRFTDYLDTAPMLVAWRR